MTNPSVPLPEQPERLDLRSHDAVAGRLQELLRLFPEVRTEDGKLDFERLKLALGTAVDSGPERFGMNWPGKADCFKAIQTPSMATLRPCPEESVRFDTTENLIIEGDNLEVLKLLQKAYQGKIKMIYIDPPYNTGNDFIYPDDYSESLHTYLKYTGQVDAEGAKFGTNLDIDGRFHSKWISMMYPRLFLSRNLLRDDGLMVISCSDTESGNLQSILNNIFGERCFIGNVVWNSTKSVTNTALVSVAHTHNFIYARNIDYFVEHRHHFRLPELGEGFSNPDNDPRGPWKADPFQVGGERPNQRYPIVNPRTGVTYLPNPGGSWKNEKAVFDRLLAENRIVFGASGEAGPQRKRFYSEALERGRVAKTLWTDVDTTANGTRELDDLFNERVFDNPKPVNLIERFIQLCIHDPKEAIVLDFFAGSGTTAAAAIALNHSDFGGRKFILVQLPEPTGRADYPTIADITKERARRVIQRCERENQGQLDLDASKRSDLGFRVFKLAESNFTPWDSAVPHDEKTVQRLLDSHVEHLRAGRSDADLLYEILLKSGFPLDAKVETLTLTGHTVYAIAGGSFLICLERNLDMELIRAIADRKPERVVCLDRGFAGNDALKTNAVQIFKAQGVAKFQTL